MNNSNNRFTTNVGQKNSYKYALKHGALTLATLCLFASVCQGQVSVALAPTPCPQFLDNNGKPLTGGKLFTYATGTQNLLATYVDSTGTTQNANPIILNAGGFPVSATGSCGIWLAAPAYKFTLQNSLGVQQWSVDPVNAYQILTGTQTIIFAGVSSDPAGQAGMVDYRTDLGRLRFFNTGWDSIPGLNTTDTLANKTLTAPVLTNPAINGVTPNSVVPTAGQVFTALTPTTSGFQSRTVGIPFVIDGAGAVITTGSKGFIEVPFACTIVGWTILADQSGSAVVQVNGQTYSGFPAMSNLNGTDPPTLTAQQKNQNLTLTQWTTAVTAGQILEFKVNSAATVTRVTVSLRVTIP